MATTRNTKQPRKAQPRASKDFIEIYQKQHLGFTPIRLTSRGDLLGEGATGQVFRYTSEVTGGNIVVKFISRIILNSAAIADNRFEVRK